MAPHSVDDLARSFERHLRPGSKSPRTIETYLQAVDQFAAHLRANRKANGGRGLADARGEDVEAFVVTLLDRYKPATASNRYRGLHAFYRWLEDEEEIPHPMRKLKPPAVPDQPVPVIGEPQLRRLLAVCAGKDFEARRDTAIILLLIDAGPRRSELAGMRLDAVDFEYEVIRVVGKGGRQRALPLGR
jgi:site-specific recombinase XerD